MSLNRLLSGLLAGLCVVLVGRRAGIGGASIFTAALLPLLSLIWHSTIWACSILPCGRVASRASDAKEPPPAAVVAAIGWILLCLLTYALL